MTNSDVQGFQNLGFGSALQFAPENYFFQGSRAGNGASSTAGRFVSNSPEQTVVHAQKI